MSKEIVLDSSVSILHISFGTQLLGNINNLLLSSTCISRRQVLLVSCLYLVVKHYDKQVPHTLLGKKYTKADYCNAVSCRIQAAHLQSCILSHQLMPSTKLSTLTFQKEGQVVLGVGGWVQQYTSICISVLYIFLCIAFLTQISLLEQSSATDRFLYILSVIVFVQ